METWKSASPVTGERNAAFTQYYIRHGYIFGPDGYTEYYLARNCIYGPKGFTQYYFQDGYIFGPNGFSCFFLQNDCICGPETTMPWDETASAPQRALLLYPANGMYVCGIRE